MNNNEIKRETHKGHDVVLEYDSFPINPIVDCDILAEFCCYHSRYNLGNMQDQLTTPEDIVAYVETVKRNGGRAYPLYVYDHGSITIALHDNFPDQKWDVSQVGFCVLTPQRVRENFRTKRTSKKQWETAEEVMKAEVKEYDRYLRGEAYCWLIKDANGEIVDSCSGYSDPEYAWEEAIAGVKRLLKK